jgi:hypothetical protein
MVVAAIEPGTLSEIALPSGTITAEQIDVIHEHFAAEYEREYTYRLTAPARTRLLSPNRYSRVDKLKPEKHPKTGESFWMP